MLDLQTARGWQVVNGSAAALDSDELLLARGRAGDSAALERLLASHESSLLSLCRGVLPRREDAEDAVQESFFRALRGMHRFRGDCSVRTWLFRIAINVCLEWKRSRRLVHTPLTEDLGGRHPSPEPEALRRAQIESALSNLLPRQRAVILMKELHGFSVAEIGATLGWSAVRVQNELYRARKQLAAWRQTSWECEP